MGKIVHILTVGTSLLTNRGGKSRGGDYQGNINRLNNSCETILEQAPTHPRVDSLLTYKDELLKKLQKLNLDKEIGFRPPQHGKTDRMPQELSYLKIHIKEHPNEPKADCYLLTSYTNTGVLCGEAIKEYVNSHCELKKKFEVVRCEKIEGVDDTKGKDFKNKGFRNLIDKINEIIDKVEKEAQNEDVKIKIYLNITGGYKGLVPYSTLQAMIRSDKVALCYLFEKSPEIIEMPIYPIGLDFHLWHRNATKLRMARNPEASSYFYCHLDEKMKNLLYDDETGRKELFSLGKHLEDKYQEQLKQDPIKVYSREIIRRLLPDSSGDEAKKLRGVIEKLVDRVGDLIWEGDKIPEEVNHALNHHHNLLEFAELFLIPILDEKVDPHYLNVKERFCLLAGILLHDCGHSLDYMETDEFDRVPLFPSEIREFHHFLSCQRLNNPKTAEELEWPGKNGLKEQELDENLHNAVLTICLYHRKSMGYIKQGKHPNNPFTDKNFPSLKDYIKNKFSDIDLMKVVALMRLIDGCDIQTRRAGRKKEEIEMTRKLLERDYRTALDRAVRAVKLWQSEFEASNNNLKSTFGDVNSAIQVDSAKGKDSVSLKDEDRKAHVLCLEKLQNGTEDEKRLAKLWLIVAELVDRAEMIQKQKCHYLKHQCVKEVQIIPAENFCKDNLAFEIRLIENDIVASYLNKPCSEANGKTLRQIIEEEISGEYESIKDYRHKLSVICRWENKEPFYPRSDSS
ncbi:MAG: hypothetical protein J7K33_10615 [Candidatus Marinimicrobia bacterium]|nr:hypothetical protein [Candidatus Neomarinimicrobiota bacterium]